MKKLFTVLAVLLVASLAFAGFSGSVKAQYNFNFDEKTITYGKPGMGTVDATFNWDSQTYTVGDAEGTHIDFALAASFEGFYNLSADHADGYDPYKKASAWAWSLPLNGKVITDRALKSLATGLTLKVKTFKIVAENFEINFLGDLALDFAKSAIDTKKFNSDTLEENVQNYSLGNSLKGKHNLTVTAYGYKFGFGLGAGKTDGDVLVEDWTDAVTFALTGVTPEYDFGGVKAQFGAAYQVVDNDWRVAASAKASYAADKWSVSAAYDMDREDKKDYIENELAVAFSFDPVAVDVYYNNDGAKAEDKYKDYFWTTGDKPAYVAEYHEDPTATAKLHNYLSTKVVVDVAKVAENVPVTVTLTGKNLLNEDCQVVSVKATTTIVPNFKFGAYFNDWFNNEAKPAASNDNNQKLGATVEFTGVERLTLNAEVAYKFAKDLDAVKRLYINAGASYAHDLFTASATVGMEKPYDQDAIFGATVGATSTTLVKGAELSAKARFNLKNIAVLDTADTNDLTFACKVSF